MKVKFYIDTREQSLIDCFENNDFLEKHQLDIGDFQILIDENVKVVIERKTVSDLESSIKDMRYKEQKLRATLALPDALYIILIEGSFLFNDMTVKNKILTSAVINSLIRDKIHFIWTTNVKDTALFLNCIMTRVSEDPKKYFNLENSPHDNHEEIFVKQKKKQNLCQRTVILTQLCAIPGISYKKAKNIVEVHDIDNMYSLCKKMAENTPYEFFKEVKGIGKKLQNSIYIFCGIDPTTN